jgi:CubicO group peptidase (beta-lactamase class C family)
LTKTFIAVPVMRLRDEGRLGLDDPVEKHLADAPAPLATGQIHCHTAGVASEAGSERRVPSDPSSWTSWVTAPSKQPPEQLSEER